jgi:ankyrin repeat protein
MRASIGGHESIVRELLAAGANVNLARWNKSTALYYAAVSDRPAVISILKGAGADGDPVRIKLTNRLIRAASKNWNRDRASHSPYYPGIPPNLDKAEELDAVLAAGADVNGTNPAGYTALMFAANLGLLDAVESLLKRGADVNRRSVFGDTALSLASRYDLKDVIARLKSAGAK